MESGQKQFYFWKKSFQTQSVGDYIHHTKIIEIIISMKRWEIKRLEKQNLRKKGMVFSYMNMTREYYKCYVEEHIKSKK